MFGEFHQEGVLQFIHVQPTVRLDGFELNIGLSFKEIVLVRLQVGGGIVLVYAFPGEHLFADTALLMGEFLLTLALATHHLNGDHAGEPSFLLLVGLQVFNLLENVCLECRFLYARDSWLFLHGAGLEHLCRGHDPVFKRPHVAFLKVVVDVALTLPLHESAYTFHSPLLVCSSASQQLLCLFAEHYAAFLACGGHATSGVDRVPNQRELRLMVSNHTHHTRPGVDADFDFEFQLVTVLARVLLDNIHELLRKIKGSSDRCFLPNVLA